jgi:hypothetical protein
MTDTKANSDTNLITLKISSNKNYSTIALAVVENKNLSWGAKGLHTYLISRPPGWQLHYADLINRSVNGRYALKSCLQELKQAQLVKIITVRGAAGRFDTQWIVSETPQIDKPLSVEPHTDSPHTGKPLAVEPTAVNPQGISYQGISYQGISYQDNKDNNNKQQQTDVVSEKAVVVEPSKEEQVKLILQELRGSPFANISVSAISSLLSEKPFKEILLTAEMLVYQYHRKPVDNPVGCFRTCALLPGGMAKPVGFVSKAERRAKEDKAHMEDKARKEEEANAPKVDLVDIRRWRKSFFKSMEGMPKEPATSHPRGAAGVNE